MKAKGGGKWGPSNVAARTAARAMTVPAGLNTGGMSQWKPVVEYLRDNNLTPTVLFVFSKKKCEAAVESLSNVDLLPDKADKARVHSFFESAMQRLNEADRQIPQVMQVRENLKRGLASHHAGLLPIVKEVTEMLFSQGFVSILFATETFAMGVNMPARAVVFTALRKHDGRDFRFLEPGEYTQMAGRAGRRGIDTTGNVFLFFSENERVLEEWEMKKVLTGRPITLKSAFRLTYNMILNILRVDELRVEEMMKKSFSEAAGEQKIDSVTVALERVRNALNNSKIVEDGTQNESLIAAAEGEPVAAYSLADYARDIVRISQFPEAWDPNAQINPNATSQPNMHRQLTSGRVVITSNEDGMLFLGVVFSSSFSQDNRSGNVKNEKSLCVAMIVGCSDNAKPVPKSILIMDQGSVEDGTGDKSSSKARGSKSQSLELNSKGGLKVKMVIMNSKNVAYICDVQESVSKSRDKKQSDFVRQWTRDGTTYDKETATEYVLEFLDTLVAQWVVTAKENPGGWLPLPVKSQLVLTLGSGGAGPPRKEGQDAIGPAYNNERERGDGNGSERVIEVENSMSRLERIRYICSSEEAANVLEAIPLQDRGRKVAETVQKEKIRVQIHRLQEYAQTGNIPSLLPEYHKRVQLLQKMDYVGPDGMSVQLKGRCACEVATVDSVLLTELVLENVLQDLDSCEVAALLSALVCRKKNSGDATKDAAENDVFSDAYLTAMSRMREIAEDFGRKQEECGISLEFDVTEEDKSYEDAMCRWELCEVVLKWARGATFASLAELTEVQAGDVVVCIKRLSELLKDTQSVAKTVGNTELWDIVQGGIDAIQRDIIFSGSLYLD